MTKLLYFQDVVGILLLEPVLCEQACSQVEAWESASGRRVPRAVREFYTIRGLVDAISSKDHAFCVATLSGFLDKLRSMDADNRSIEFIGPDRVNTGYEAYFEVDGTDDPLIVDGTTDQPPKFSKYMKDLVWNEIECHALMAQTSRSNQNSESPVGICGPTELAFLNREFALFDSEIRQGFFDKSQQVYQFRFYRAQERLELETREDPSKSEVSARYSLYADNFDQLLDLYERCQPAHGAKVLLRIGSADRPELVSMFKARFPSVVLEE